MKIVKNRLVLEVYFEENTERHYTVDLSNGSIVGLRGTNLTSFPKNLTRIIDTYVKDTQWAGLINLLRYCYTKYYTNDWYRSYYTDRLLNFIERMSIFNVPLLGFSDYECSQKYQALIEPSNWKTLYKAIKQYIENNQITPGLTASDIFACWNTAMYEQGFSPILTRWEEIEEQTSLHNNDYVFSSANDLQNFLVRNLDTITSYSDYGWTNSLAKRFLSDISLQQKFANLAMTSLKQGALFMLTDKGYWLRFISKYFGMATALNMPIDTGNIMRNYMSTFNSYKAMQFALQDSTIKANQQRVNLAYENENFVVVVPTSTAEFVAEGNALHNCLGGYELNNYILNGKRMVAFVRKKSAPTVPYLALDIDYNGDICQYLIFGNDRPKDELTCKFKQEYQEYLYSLKKANPNEILFSIY